MKRTHYSLLLILLVILLGCKGKEDGTEINFRYEISDSLIGKHDAIVYTLPSPMQVATLIKLMDIHYSDELVAATKKIKTFNGTSTQKALFLGLILVDLGYVTIFEQYSPNHTFLYNIEKISTELGLKESETKKALERFEKSINNKDSLKLLTYSFLTDLDETFRSAKDRRLPLLIISGMLVESMYILTETYEEQLSKKIIGKIMRNNFNSMILQNQIYLNNLKDLLTPFGKDPEIAQILTQMEKLSSLLTKMNISYLQDSKTGKIINVILDYKELTTLRNYLKVLREHIIAAKF